MDHRASGRSPTALVIGEEPGIRRLLKGVGLGPRQVVSAIGGAQGLQMAGLVRPHVVVLRAELPDLSGMYVLRRLRALDQHVPVIVVASSGSRGTVRRAMELGAFDYLTRPFEDDAMRAAVREALRMRPPALSAFGGQADGEIRP